MRSWSPEKNDNYLVMQRSEKLRALSLYFKNHTPDPGTV
jgi:hypothetical protein